MEILLTPQEAKRQGCDKATLKRAQSAGKRILKIVWDKEDGYPQHSWGFVQWSIRPYEQRYGCDGTTDGNIHLIALRLCEALGLDYPALYEKAYAARGTKPGRSWIRTFDWPRVEEETIIPKLSEQSLRHCLHDLGEINNRSILAVLEDEFTNLGYSVENWWEEPNPHH